MTDPRGYRRVFLPSQDRHLRLIIRSEPPELAKAFAKPPERIICARGLSVRLFNGVLYPLELTAALKYMTASREIGRDRGQGLAQLMRNRRKCLQELLDGHSGNR